MRFAGTKIANFLGDKPNYDEMGSQATVESARGIANTALNNAKAADASMRAQAEVLAAEANADAIAAQGQAQATASMANSIGGAIGGLAGGFSKLGGAGAGGFSMSSGMTGNFTDVNPGVLSSLGYGG